MSERDEFRECMAREVEAADEMAGELGRNSYSYGKAAGLRFALHEYDRLAPDREREKRALALVESLTVTGRRCPENCILQPSCYYLAEGAKLPCLVLRERCIQLGILPAEAK